VRRGPRLSLEELAPFLLPVPEQPGAISFQELFGNQHPVEMEVGFGKGLFLLNSALKNPGTNYVGVEIVRKYQLFAATRIAMRKLPNVKLACGDANLFLRDFIAPGSLETIHIYFPDPWWKNRHHKRRIFTDEFIERCLAALRVGGHLSIVTDVEDYFMRIQELITPLVILKPLPLEELPVPQNDMDYLTNFERKFRKEGKPIYRGRWELLNKLVKEGNPA